ncbi:denitrification regulatory protein NirQ [Burkholderia sp. THE68]|uniref:CbbQ/NirQ/NorQ/GpvN family protein n=1 Tax=Burkholderia sp. THE68 TaxID=758782 RepID=UPI00131682DF|nr:CbbQ/NirQ/NorQ/GpvN family protein [Burkholderia sp. THE68]BBU30295.1 denitrification regulatory protein NirQ [Burkholderia sp. THE68]
MNERIKPYLIQIEPYYRAVGQEIGLFEAAYARRMPLILKGPTGCGKTRFIEYMAWRLGKPVVTIACNEDLTASDLIGRYLLDREGTVWHDGPLTLAVRYGAICYLDEVIEARPDTTVAIHPLADDRRVLPIDRLGELLHAHPDFQLVMSYNPGYQSNTKDLKTSTKQRFGALDFGYPDEVTETAIIVKETSVAEAEARKLVGIAQRSRELRGRGLEEGISTRMLVRAGSLIADGIEPHVACRLAMTMAVTDDEDVIEALNGFVDAFFNE